MMEDPQKSSTTTEIRQITQDFMSKILVENVLMIQNPRTFLFSNVFLYQSQFYKTPSCAEFWWDFYTWWLENKTHIWHLFNKSPWESILVGLHNEISDDWLETIWSHMIPESLDVPCFILTCWIPWEPVPNILARSAIWPKVTPRHHQLVNIWLVWKKQQIIVFRMKWLTIEGVIPLSKEIHQKIPDQQVL